MQLHHVEIKNFRLLASVNLAMEKLTTVIVGRNNSGKTSFSEVLRRMLSDGNSLFQLEDFSSACYDGFCAAYQEHRNQSDDATVRALLPFIELRLTFKYAPGAFTLGPLSPFVIDLDPECSLAVAVVRYELKPGKLDPFFEDLPDLPLTSETRLAFFRNLRERIPTSFAVSLRAEDPNDAENQKELSVSALKTLVKMGFINAQRGLDDVTSRESGVLAKTVEHLFASASSPSADAADKQIAETLKEAVKGIQGQIDTNFGGQLQSLIPALQSFGYPGLGTQEIYTETLLDIEKLLSNFTKVRYAGYGGVTLPESYNGLGARNLIFILLQLAGFYKAFRAETTAPGVHLVFIEEPEAHLHPQMQEVFIRQLEKTAKLLVEASDDKRPWPVQFVVSTHSSHVANEAGFESIRYFLGKSAPGKPEGIRQTVIKDLRKGLTAVNDEDKKFLHQYMTLTRCDLFFADKAILVEGLSERLLLPVIVGKLETAESDRAKLSSQYVTTLEVGGAYAHLFFDLLRFLELRSLIITDLDSVEVPGGTACEVHRGTYSSNACLKNWFSEDAPYSLAGLLSKTLADKVKEGNRIAYQCPETEDGPCGRTFEDAFILANPTRFGLTQTTSPEKEIEARSKASALKKSEFALKHAIVDLDWNAPRYLMEGLRWLRDEPELQTPDPALAIAVQAALTSEESNDE
ncbi:MAG: ATP-dependent endonuclease [Verrucomicrobiota bacterium]